MSEINILLLFFFSSDSEEHVHTDIHVVQYISKMAKRECKNHSSLFACWTTSSKRTKMDTTSNELDDSVNISQRAV